MSTKMNRTEQVKALREQNGWSMQTAIAALKKYELLEATENALSLEELKEVVRVLVKNINIQGL